MRRPALDAAAVTVAQLAAYAGLAATGSWGASTGALARGALLACVLALLAYGTGAALGGRRQGLVAAAVWVVAPVLLLRYWVAGGGSPPVAFSPIFHRDFLPLAFGVQRPGAVVAGCLLAAACWLVLAHRLPALPAAAAAGAAAGAAACG